MSHNFIDVKKLLLALSVNSPGGKQLLPEEYDKAHHGPKSGDLESAKKEALIGAINSVETDGSRISSDEMTLLGDRYFHPGTEDFFKALAIESSRQNITLFSPEALSLIGKIDEAEEISWFDVHQKFIQIGMFISFDDAKQITTSFHGKASKLLAFESFWKFTEEYLVPFYIQNERKKTIILDGLTYDFMGKGIFRLYSSYNDMIENGTFIRFKEFIEENFIGVRIVDDIAYYIDLFRDESRITALRQHSKLAQKITHHLPIRGSLNIDDIENLRSLSQRMDEIEEISTFVEKVATIFNLRRPAVTLKDIPIILSFFDNPTFRELVTSDKISQYFAAIVETDRPLGPNKKARRRPKTWDDVKVFTSTVTLLPDDISLFTDILAMLNANDFDLAIIYNGIYGDFDYDYGFRSSIEVSQSEVLQAFEILSNSPTIRKVLQRFKELHPETITRLALVDIVRLSQLALEPNVLNWIEYDQILVSARKRPDPKGTFPLDGLVCMLENPGQKESVRTIIEDYSELVEITGLGCEGIKIADKILDELVDSSLYRILINEFKLSKIDWFMLYSAAVFQAGRHIQGISDPEFRAGVKTLFSSLEKIASEENLENIRTYSTITSLLRIYKNYPEIFRKLTNLSPTALEFYLPVLANSEETPSFATDIDIISGRHKFIVSDGISLIAAMEIKGQGLLRIIPSIYKGYSFPNNLYSKIYFILSAYEIPGSIKRLADPDIQSFYRKMATGDPSTRFPYTIQLPEIWLPQRGISFFDQPIWKKSLKALPLLFDHRTAFHKLDMIKIDLSWEDYSELFNCHDLIAAIESDEFTSYIHEIKTLPRIGISTIIEYAKLVHSGITLENIDSIKALGFSTPEEDLLSLKLIDFNDPTLQDPKFKTFIDRITTRFLSDSYSISNLPGFLNLFTIMKSDRKTLGDIFSEKFREILRLLVHKYELALNASTIAGAYKIFRSDISIKKITELATHINRSIVPNDLITLTMIASQLSLEELFYDRDRLISKIKRLLSKHSFLERSSDGIIGDRSSIPGYSERPDNLENFDILFLIRAYALLNRLRDETFIKKIKELAERDIADTRTEYGGVIEYDGVTHEIMIEQKESDSYRDGAFRLSFDPDFYGGLAGFHLHALNEDSSEYSGPSRQDLHVSESHKIPGLVITTCGRDHNGELIINLDLYLQTTSERKAGESILMSFERPTWQILDLGLY